MPDSGYTAFIDESGDEGFTFRNLPDRGSSQWFVLSALVVRDKNRRSEMEAWKAQIESVFNGPWNALHFHKLKHEQRSALTHYLSRRPFRIVSVCWDKRAITEDGKQHSLMEPSRLHHYAIRYLMERLSWLSHFNSEPEGSERLKLVFSKCKNLEYSKLKTYLTGLKSASTKIRWNAIDVDSFKVRAASELLGLKAADVVASGIARGLELSPHQLCEDAHCRHLKAITYKHEGRHINYGLKIMPRIPPAEPERDHRYRWIEDYQN